MLFQSIHIRWSKKVGEKLNHSFAIYFHRTCSFISDKLERVGDVSRVQKMQFCLLNKTVESRTHRNLSLVTAFVSTEGCHVFLCRESYYFMIHEIKNRNFKKIEQKDEKMWRRKWREAALSFYCLIITVFIFTNSIVYHSIALFMLFQMILNSNCHICNSLVVNGLFEKKLFRMGITRFLST